MDHCLAFFDPTPDLPADDFRNIVCSQEFCKVGIQLLIEVRDRYRETQCKETHVGTTCLAVPGPWLCLLMSTFYRSAEHSVLGPFFFFSIGNLILRVVR